MQMVLQGSLALDTSIAQGTQTASASPEGLERLQCGLLNLRRPMREPGAHIYVALQPTGVCPAAPHLRASRTPKGLGQQAEDALSSSICSLSHYESSDLNKLAKGPGALLGLDFLGSPRREEPGGAGKEPLLLACSFRAACAGPSMPARMTENL
jgi:hypothetical protein